MKTGTFWCWLWGHKFRGYVLELTPHAEKAIQMGLTTSAVPGDYIRKYFQTDHCIRCGIDKPKVDLTGKQE